MEEDGERHELIVAMKGHRVVMCVAPSRDRDRELVTPRTSLDRNPICTLAALDVGGAASHLAVRGPGPSDEMSS